MTSSIITNDEKMNNYTDNRSINHYKLLPIPVVDDLFPKKICRMKNIHWNIFPRNISLSLEELVPVIVSQ